uniref:ORF56d n=1 Tax=Pinus koraiensis TaxID=88728 RepID=A4QM59_PINKO|nr:ORF56d [Pinus koraiensis]ABP35396.1 ORF56d [Pinus koraiensis]
MKMNGVSICSDFSYYGDILQNPYFWTTFGSITIHNIKFLLQFFSVELLDPSKFLGK